MEIRSQQEALFIACEMEKSAIQLYTRALMLLDQQGRQLALVRGTHVEQRRHQVPAAQLHVVPLGQLRHPLPGHVAVQQAGQKEVAQQGQALP